MKNGKKRTNEDGSKIWRLNGKFHRTDGPAMEYANGSKFWYLNDLLHRTDGPAMEYANGDKCWFLNGKYYGRGDTPSVEYVLEALIYDGMS